MFSGQSILKENIVNIIVFIFFHTKAYVSIILFRNPHVLLMITCAKYYIWSPYKRAVLIVQNNDTKL